MFTGNFILKKNELSIKQYILEFWHNLCIIFVFLWILKERVKIL